MCGDDDDNGSSRFEELLYTRFLASARALLAQQEARNPGRNDEVVATIDKLFTDALSRAVKDTEGVGEDQQYAVLSMQPLVFARLAGFLAGHLSLQEDPLRKVMEAMMHGYSEAESIDRSGHDHGDGWHSH
jgi:hypothetical protein